MKRAFALLFFLACCAPTVFSQGRTTDDYNKVEVYGGYSHNRIDTGIGDGDPDVSDIINERTGFNGFNASATGNVTRYVGLKFEFAAHFNSKNFSIPGGGTIETHSRLYTYAGGLQLKNNSRSGGALRPFGEALFGVAHATADVCVSGNAGFDVDDIPPCGNNPIGPIPPRTTDNAFTAVIGGGLDIRAGERFSVRVIQFDYAPTRFGGETQHNFRFGAGLVFNH